MMFESMMEALEVRQLLAATAVGTFDAVTVPENSPVTTVSLTGKFDDPAIAGTVVRFNSVMGTIYVELENARAPLTVANFLRYANAGRYTNTFIHRSVVTPTPFIIQGGGYAFNSTTGQADPITRFAAVTNEPGISNTRGTIAMAKVDGQPNSATDQWFFNLADNSANLDALNGGFTVFGHVVGSGMNVVDAIAALPTANLGGVFTSTPVDGTDADPLANRLVTFSSISVAPKLSYSVVSNSNPGLASLAVVNGSQLSIVYLSDKQGQADVVVRATALDGTTADSTLHLTVTPPALLVQPTAVAEGNSGSKEMTFTVSMNSSSGQPVTVHYTTVDGTDTVADNDYAAASGTLTFDPGQTVKTVSVAVAGDTTAESNEAFALLLSEPTGATIATAQAGGTIANDDPGGQIKFGAGGYSTTQKSPSVTLTVSRTEFTGPATVHYATSNGTAVAGKDYTAKSGELVFVAGQTSATFTITQINDHKAGESEFFYVTLSQPTNGALLVDPMQVSVLITNTTPDVIAPTAKLGTLTAPKAGNNAYIFPVTYTDNVMVKRTTIKGGNIQVLGPLGYNKPAKLISASSTTDAKTITARYQIPAPTGGWKKANDGVYTFWIMPKQVSDTKPLFAAKRSLGTLKEVTSTAKARPAVAMAETAVVQSKPAVMTTAALTPFFASAAAVFNDGQAIADPLG